MPARIIPALPEAGTPFEMDIFSNGVPAYSQARFGTKRRRIDENREVYMANVPPFRSSFTAFQPLQWRVPSTKNLVFFRFRGIQ